MFFSFLGIDISIDMQLRYVSLFYSIIIGYLSRYLIILNNKVYVLKFCMFYNEKGGGGGARNLAQLLHNMTYY